MLSRLKNGVRGWLRGAAANGATVARTASNAESGATATAERPAADEEVLTYDASGDSACPRGPILSLERCPVCGGAESTRVSRYNRLVLFDRTPDAASAIYNYALCHACGVVFAERRPAAERYKWLLERFEETLGRTEVGAPRPGKFALSSSSLTDDAREQLRRMAANGVFVSGHSGMTRKDYLPSLMNDRLAASMHVEILGSLLTLQAPRVLEVRSRLGSISEMLRRLYGASCSAMTIFENQRFLIEEVYGFPAASPIEFDHFAIPFDGCFDLIVSNHMLTHTVRPKEFLETVRNRLTPGGHLYLYGEPMEGEFLDRGKSMFNTLNPFHLQTFNEASAVRALEANGFKVIFCTVRDDLFLALAQAVDAPGDGWERMSERERSRRRAAYRTANDAAILRVPEHLRAPFAKDWDAVVERALAGGIATRSRDGRVRVRRVEGQSDNLDRH
jgi:SAM-dependent methyltransferase